MPTVGTKAAAGAGGLGLSAALVTLIIYFAGLHPPPEVVGALETVIGIPITYAAVWLTPHNGGTGP